jgi:hypothetical protein
LSFVTRRRTRRIDKILISKNSEVWKIARNVLRNMRTVPQLGPPAACDRYPLPLILKAHVCGQARYL